MIELEREINKDIRRIGHQVKKAERHNTCDNKHYYQRLRLLRWLIMFKLAVKSMDDDQIGELYAEAGRHMRANTPNISTSKEADSGEKD